MFKNGEFLISDLFERERERERDVYAFLTLHTYGKARQIRWKNWYKDRTKLNHSSSGTWYVFFSLKITFFSNTRDFVRIVSHIDFLSFCGQLITQLWTYHSIIPF